MRNDRIVLLDALRGLAILGILICNIPTVFVPEIVAESVPLWPHGQAPASIAVWWVTQVFFQQKFVTLFGMLFGASILLVGGEGGDRARTEMVIKRLAALVAIGFFHGLVIWHGDVMSYYALVGLLVLWVRGWSARRLLTIGIIVHLCASSLILWRLFSSAATLDKPMPPAALAQIAEKSQAATMAFTGDFASSLAETTHTYLDYFSGSWHWPPVWPLKVLGLLLIGMGLFKSGLLKGEVSPTVYKTLVAIGLGVLALVGVVLSLYLAIPSKPAVLARLSYWMQAATAPFVSLGYLGLLALAARAKVWWPIPKILAPVGQMAFTNYLMQSVIMTVLSYGGRGPVLYGKLDRPALAGIVVITWIVQIAWSQWWLKRFTMGPLEWLWRLAYRGPKPLRRTIAPTPQASA